METARESETEKTVTEQLKQDKNIIDNRIKMSKNNKISDQRGAKTYFISLTYLHYQKH